MGLPKRNAETHRPHRGGSRAGLSSVVTLAGQIIEVDPVRWTCVVRTEVFERTYRDVPIGSSYLHYYGGEGLHIMPEPGAAVWITVPSEGDTRPFISGYRPYNQKGTTSSSSKPDLRSNRPVMNPGEIFAQTRDGNGIRLRRGRVTEVFGSPLSRTLYLGRSGTIHTIFQNLKISAIPGSVSWSTERAEKDPEGRQATVLSMKVKEYASDKAHVVHLESGGQLSSKSEGDADGESGVVGSAPQASELVTSPVLRIRVFEDGDVEAGSLSEASSASFDKNGQIEVATKGSVQVEIRGDRNVTLTLGKDGTVSVAADGTITSTSGELSVTNDGATVKVGAGAAKVLYDLGFSEAFSAAWAEVSTFAKAFGIPTPGVDSLIVSLNAKGFTSEKLETD